MGFEWTWWTLIGLKTTAVILFTCHNVSLKKLTGACGVCLFRRLYVKPIGVHRCVCACICAYFTVFLIPVQVNSRSCVNGKIATNPIKGTMGAQDIQKLTRQCICGGIPQLFFQTHALYA